MPNRLGEALQEYCKHLTIERQLSTHTLKKYQWDLSKLQGWFETQQYACWEQVSPQQLRYYISQLLNTSPDDPLLIRDHAILELFYSSGLRLSELSQLDIDGIDLSQKQATVTGKGNKTRLTPIGSSPYKCLQKWLKSRSLLAKLKEPALFVSKRGIRNSNRQIQNRVKHFAQLMGLQGNFQPHILRHSFASHLDFSHLTSVYDSSHPRAKRKK